MRKTKIIATLGPACFGEPKLKELIEAGVNVFRSNASHATPKELESWIKTIRKISAQMKTPVSVLIDLQGPRIRTGALQDKEGVVLEDGAEVVIEAGDGEGAADHFYTSCEELPEMLKVGNHVLLDNGTMKLEVIGITGKEVRCKVIHGGKLGENKGINLPNANVTLPTLTEKDCEMLAIAAKHQIDYIALSFVRSAKDVLNLKTWLDDKGYPAIPVISKIEKPVALECIDEILDASEGIMVARGDLGIEVGVERLPLIQKDLIETATKKGVPVITATQMLESMITETQPTRAEVSDVANAVFDGTDAVMLSGETSIGHNPVAVVKVMARIAEEAEKHDLLEFDDKLIYADLQEKSPIKAITRAARVAAKNISAKAIIVFTTSWHTAVLISKLSPQQTIIALTPSEEIERKLTLLRGVVPIRMKFSGDAGRMFKDADNLILKKNLLEKNDDVVIVCGKKSMPPQAQYMTKVHRIGSELD